MFFESQTLISILAIIILFLSFIASFKHQNALIFITGLLTSLLVSKCDKFIPIFKNYFEPFNSEVETKKSDVEIKKDEEKKIEEKKNEVKKNEEKKYKEKKDMTADKDNKIDDVDAQALVTTNISKLENYNEQRNVYGLGRPTMGEVLNGTGDLKKLTPDFVTFGHVLVGNLRFENDIDLDANIPDEEKPQNPELLKLAKPGLIPNTDYFPNCKLGGVIKNLKKRDRRDTNRCDSTRHNM